ncbi:hypothetical protein BHL89_00840 [Limosilactobacillus reuteri]|uniref:TerB N-terminal domain-containing protein n=1 Tax=Limosilactobacillus reuteri TaxID=1598 RepID=UPI000A2D503E|nr:TerB N-terminal domain-containing protein [Limosilactobacillus reuteri]OTA45516.1 hypothetical protein BHL89_00840 [Limosilactobacillus reuteri]
MGLFSWLLNRNKQQNSTPLPTTKTKEMYLNSFMDNIDSEILSLLYFKNGARKNIELSSDEPSAINLKLPISRATPEPTGYFPSYEKFSPAQRNFFLTWLQNLNKIDDLGYPFLLLYCSERHIYENTAVDQAVNLISRLQSTFNNDSFNYYSSVAIAWAARKYEKPEYLSEMDLQKLPVVIGVAINLFFYKKIEPEFIMNNASQLGWTNKRYIKKYPDLFKKELTDYFIDNYNCPYFPVPKEINQNKVNTVPLILSNFSLPKEERVFLFPNFLNTKEVGETLCTSLMSAHKKVKIHLRHHSNEYKKSKSTTTKRINTTTGYPMFKQSSIERIEQNIEYAQKTNYFNKQKALQSAEQSINSNGANFQIQKYKVYIADLVGMQGELAYEKGEWDIAEQKLLSTVPYDPASANRLAIMYRKEKRFKDEIELLTLAIKTWQESIFNIYHGTTDELEKRLAKAKNNFEKHKSKDMSQGLRPHFISYDKEFVQKLLDIRNSKC